jgi:hypothetical protein
MTSTKSPFFFCLAYVINNNNNNNSCFSFSLPPLAIYILSPFASRHRALNLKNWLIIHFGLRAAAVLTCFTAVRRRVSQTIQSNRIGGGNFFGRSHRETPNGFEIVCSFQILLEFSVSFSVCYVMNTAAHKYSMHHRCSPRRQPSGTLLLYCEYATFQRRERVSLLYCCRVRYENNINNDY